MNETAENINLDKFSSLSESADSSVKNQYAKTDEVRVEDEEYNRNGNLFLENEGIELPKSVYVSSQELIEALEKTMNSTNKKKKIKVTIQDKIITDDNLESIRIELKKASAIVVKNMINAREKIDGRAIVLTQ